MPGYVAHVSKQIILPVNHTHKFTEISKRTKCTVKILLVNYDRCDTFRGFLCVRCLHRHRRLRLIS